jgi:hypothetical protein
MPSVTINFDGTPASGESAKNNMKPMFAKGKRNPAREAALMRKMKADKCKECGKKMKDCECEGGK